MSRPNIDLLSPLGAGAAQSTRCGTVMAAGQNEYGECLLGHNISPQGLQVCRVPGQVTCIAAGNEVSLACMPAGAAGSVVAAGYAAIPTSSAPKPVHGTWPVHSLQPHAWQHGSEHSASSTTQSPEAPPRLGVRQAAAAARLYCQNGAEHAVLVGAQGRGVAWGHNSRGQLGVGKLDGRVIDPLPLRLPAHVRIASVAVSYYHSVFLAVGGQVFTCGRNDVGQLGLGDTQDRHEPALVSVLHARQLPVAVVAAGYYHTLFALEHGGVLACGGNHFHQCGRAGEASQAYPVPVQGALGVLPNAVPDAPSHAPSESIASLAASELSSPPSTPDSPESMHVTGASEASVAPASTVFTGQSPDHRDVTPPIASLLSGEHRRPPLHTQSPSMAPVRRPARRSPAGHGNNSVNTPGAIGIIERHLEELHAAPLPCATTARAIKVRALAAGEHHSVACTESGQVYAWGRNHCGQCGVEDSVHTRAGSQCVLQPAALAMADLADTDRIVGIAAGCQHTVCFSEAGYVWGCGGNKHNALALPTTDHRSNVCPMQLLRSLAPYRVLDAACGFYHTLWRVVPRQMPDVLAGASLEDALAACLGVLGKMLEAQAECGVADSTPAAAAAAAQHSAEMLGNHRPLLGQIAQDMAALRQAGVGFDAAVLDSTGERHDVHLSLLAARVPMVARMLRSKQNLHTTADGMVEIQLSNAAPSVVRAMVDWVYTDCLPAGMAAAACSASSSGAMPQRVAHMVQLLKLAEQLRAQGLADQIESLLRVHVQPCSALAWLWLASLLGIDSLYIAALHAALEPAAWLDEHVLCTVPQALLATVMRASAAARG